MKMVKQPLGSTVTLILTYCEDIRDTINSVNDQHLALTIA